MRRARLAGALLAALLTFFLGDVLAAFQQLADALYVFADAGHRSTPQGMRSTAQHRRADVDDGKKEAPPKRGSKKKLVPEIGT
jgi:hypothetical protein